MLHRERKKQRSNGIIVGICSIFIFYCGISFHVLRTNCEQKIVILYGSLQ